jgi:hypothetical protein
MQMLLAAWLAATVALGALSPAAGDPTWSGRPRTLHVSGAATAPGDGSATRPYPRIGQAVAAVVAGDTVLVGPGRYAEEVRTVRAGRAGAPIRIVGRPGARLVGPRGLARGRLVQVLHDHVTLQSLELSHANNVIARCGRVRFNLAGGAKNGEAVYIGKAPEQSGGRPDRSDDNRVHHNRIAATAECVDVKEAARGNRVERNRCSGSDDPDGAGFSSRGDHTTFLANLSTRHAGAGIRLGGDPAHRVSKHAGSLYPLD